MPADRLSIYGMEVLEVPPLPPRSRLYSIEPVGIGTPHVERLTSYVTRLAEAHAVPFRSLLVQEVLPMLDKAYLVPKSDKGSLWAEAARMDGMGVTAAGFLRTVQALTLRNDLHLLTMLPWIDVLAPRGLLRTTHAWCPVCYEEWRDAGQIIYDPLLWRIEAVTVCVRHHRRLSVCCPHEDCQKTLPLLAPHIRPGHCPRCGRWLGSSKEVVSPDTVSPSEGLEGEFWAAKCVGELLAAGCQSTGLLQEETVPQAINALVEHVAGNNMAFSRRVGVPDQTVWNLRNGRGRPRLDTLLQISSQLGVAPLDLLTRGAEPAETPSAGAQFSQAIPRRRNRVPLDVDRTRAYLEGVLQDGAEPASSMKQVASDLGCSVECLRHRFPELCRAISARYKAGVKSASAQRKQQLRARVRTATMRLYQQGIYPSKPKVTQLLGRQLREVDATAAWHETMRELGWEE